MRKLAPVLAVLALAAGILVAFWVRSPSAATRLARELAARPQPTPAPLPPSVAAAQWSARFRALAGAGSWAELDHLLDELEERAPVLYAAQRLGYLHARAALGAGELGEAEERLAPYLRAGNPWRALALWHATELALATGRPEEAAVRRRQLLLEHPGSLYWQQALDAHLLGLERAGDPAATLAFVAAALPLADGVGEVAAALGLDPAELAATGGEDYELCACVPPAARAAAEAAGMRWIGEVAPGPAGVVWRNAPPGSAAWRGYEH